MTDAETIASLRAELARVTAERDALAVGNLKVQHAAAERNAALKKEVEHWQEKWRVLYRKYDSSSADCCTCQLGIVDRDELCPRHMTRCSCRVDADEPSRDCPVHRGA